MDTQVLCPAVDYLLRLWHSFPLATQVQLAPLFLQKIAVALQLYCH